jgi:hypothetical protein
MQKAISNTKPTVRGAATCASDHAYAPPAQVRASSRSTVLDTKKAEPMGSHSQMTCFQVSLP